MADFASAARNAPSEDGKCWQRVELGLHCLRSSGRNWSRKVRETRNSGGLQGHEGGRGHPFSGTKETSVALFSAMTSPDPVVQRLLAGSNVFPFVFHIGSPSTTSTHPFHSAGRRFIMPV